VARPDQEQLAGRARLVSHLLTAHGGGIELLPSTKDDVVRVRFTGLCTTCPLKPLTTASIIRPAFVDMDGVSSVEVEGCRISAEAERRLLDAYAVEP
jgi:Fe-S cluster biogenesis protein NfuA